VLVTLRVMGGGKRCHPDSNGNLLDLEAIFDEDRARVWSLQERH
jgi:hypothetical protein